jgi:hypothetical protein
MHIHREVVGPEMTGSHRGGIKQRNGAEQTSEVSMRSPGSKVLTVLEQVAGVAVGDWHNLAAYTTAISSLQRFRKFFCGGVPFWAA